MRQPQEIRGHVAAYRVGPQDFSANNEMVAWRITYPAGHYMIEDCMGFVSNPTFALFPYHPHPEIPDPLDSRVRSERIRVSYPEYLNGGPGQPTLINATPGRVIDALIYGVDVEREMDSAA